MLLKQWHAGQIKPPGIPRIDWSHPLAAGLLFYGFDVGGLIVDLVADRLMNTVGTIGGNTVSPFGTGINFGSGFGSFFNSDPLIRNASAAPPWTAACAYVDLAAAIANGTPFSRTANNNGSPFINWGFQDSGTGNSQRGILNSGGSFTQIGNTVTTTPLTFSSLALVANSSASASFFFQGSQSGTTHTGLSIQSVNTNDAICFNNNSAASMVSPLSSSGIVFYGAFWSRALSQSELLLLHNDPYCFLIPAEGEMPALFLPSSGTSVTADSGSPFELVGSLRSDALVLLEYLSSVRADSVAQLEALAAVRRDSAGLPEFVEGLSVNVASQLEFLGTMRGDNLGPLETAAALRSDVLSLMETLSGRRSDMAAAGEIMASLRADLVGEAEFAAAVSQQSPANLENQGAIAVTGNSPLQLETTAKINFDQRAGTENASGILGASVGTLETTAATSRQSGASVEFVAKGQSDAAALTENSGGLMTTGSAPVQIEFLSSLASFKAAAVEIFAVIVSAVSRFLSVHGAMPPSEFGTVIPDQPPAPSIPSIEPIAIVDPGYRKLTDKGVLE